ncbi:RDD family protein [Fictibacillus sp. Mic-4]|uniref:RDD family protein n=1 Tax=Fictibacillus TaxID=1329200 RepID=UPI00041E7E59|nr:RDD family protein [Fictibacillus gelatini]
MNKITLDEEPKDGYTIFLPLKYAGFWMRFWAFLIDLIVVASLNRFVLAPFFKVENITFGPYDIFSVEGLVTTIVLYLYYVIMTKLTGQTLGKMIMNIKVLSTTGEPLTWGTVFFREVIGKMISKFLFIGYIFAAFSKRKQGFHDYFADTYVVHKDVAANE